MTTGGSNEATAATLLSIPDVVVALPCLGRSLVGGGAVGRRWFDEMFRLTVDGLAEAEAAGRAREAPDPVARAVLLISMDLDMVLLRPLVEARLGGSIADSDVVARWVRAEVDLLTRGVMIPDPATAPSPGTFADPPPTADGTVVVTGPPATTHADRSTPTAPTPTEEDLPWTTR